MNMNCKNCGKYPFCENINKKGCKEWVRQAYTKLVKVDGDIKIIERVEE